MDIVRVWFVTKFKQNQEFIRLLSWTTVHIFVTSILSVFQETENCSRNIENDIKNDYLCVAHTDFFSAKQSKLNKNTSSGWLKM